MSLASVVLHASGLHRHAGEAAFGASLPRSENLRGNYRFCTSVCRLLSVRPGKLVVRPTSYAPRSGGGSCVMFHTVTLKRPYSNN